MSINTKFFYDFIIGDYDYGLICMPQMPWVKEKPKMQSFGRNERLPLVMAAIMGLQHAFAMVGGLITPPYVTTKFSIDDYPFTNVKLQQYAISAALITSGICTIINIMHFPIPFSKYLYGKQLFLGSGVLAVIGTSFTFLPIYQSAIGQMKNNGISGVDAYGKMIGTALLCSVYQIFLSISPPQYLKRMFPPLITGITVMLIGLTLTGEGMKSWGGGSVCAGDVWKQNAQVIDLVGYGPGQVSPIPSPLCTAGNVDYLGYGSPEFFGLGFSVLCFLVLIELFGSTFMKNSNVILALLFGFLVAGCSRKDGNRFVTEDAIDAAPDITFLWVYTFKIGFYPPAIFPLLIAYTVSSIETIGDLGATSEASGIDCDSEEFTETIQGGVLNDGTSCFLASLFTSMPNTTFAQNNGVISITKCASRDAGIACGIWLILFGVFGKFAGIITSIPDCVLGGMTIFLFCSVFVSGLKIISTVDISSRRNRFILTMSMAIGVGVIIVPYAFADQAGSPYTMNFWPCGDCDESTKGLRDGVSIFLSTGYCVGPVLAVLLNSILPTDSEVFSKESLAVAEKNVDKEDEKPTTAEIVVGFEGVQGEYMEVRSAEAEA